MTRARYVRRVFEDGHFEVLDRRAALVRERAGNDIVFVPDLVSRVRAIPPPPVRLKGLHHRAAVGRKSGQRATQSLARLDLVTALQIVLQVCGPRLVFRHERRDFLHGAVFRRDHNLDPRSRYQVAHIDATSADEGIADRRHRQVFREFDGRSCLRRRSAAGPLHYVNRVAVDELWRDRDRRLPFEVGRHKTTDGAEHVGKGHEHGARVRVGNAHDRAARQKRRDNLMRWNCPRHRINVTSSAFAPNTPHCS